MAKKKVKTLPLEDPPKAIAATPKRRRSEGTSREAVTKKAKRLWSEGDEKTLLQALIDFNADTGTNPFEDKTRFFDFVKGDLSCCEVSQFQVFEKIRHLRQKYIGTSKKRVDRSFSKTYEEECSPLAKCIWRPDCTVRLTSRNVVEQGHQVSSHRSSDKDVEDDVHQELFSVSSGESGEEKGVEEGVNGEDELMAQGGQASAQMPVAQASGKNLAEEAQVLARAARTSVKNVVEEGNGGGDSESLGVDRDPNWFENSLLVQSIARLGVAQHIIKERWSKFSEETKKKIEEEWKSLESKQFQIVSLMIQYTSELASKFGEPM